MIFPLALSVKPPPRASWKALLCYRETLPKAQSHGDSTRRACLQLVCWQSRHGAPAPSSQGPVTQELGTQAQPRVEKALPQHCHHGR